MAYKELKQELESAFYHLEKAIIPENTIQLREIERIKALEHFSEVTDLLVIYLGALDDNIGRIEARLQKLGKTDVHTGNMTIEERLNNIEGCISILHMSHKGHTNYKEAEFQEMHGPQIDYERRVEGIQRKVDRIVKLLENVQIITDPKTILEL